MFFCVVSCDLSLSVLVLICPDLKRPFIHSQPLHFVALSPQYGIVLDAGSSHTALYVYKWPADKQNGTGVVTQHSECHVNGG